MKAVWIALANLRRMFRVRTNIFFVFVFPMVLILILGATFGGSDTPRLGVVTAGDWASSRPMPPCCWSWRLRGVLSG
jgi:ABC-2 type transport system permease protein